MRCFSFLFFLIIVGCNNVGQNINKHFPPHEENMIADMLRLDNNALESTIIDYLFKKSKYLKDFEKLNQYEKNILLVEYLEMEVNNGGFHQFYLNSSGNYSLETEQALKAIGAIKTLKILEAANNQFPNKSIPKDREVRIEIINQIEGKAKLAWDSLNTKFYGLNPRTGELDIDSTGVLVRKYIQTNLEQFK